GGLEDFEAAKNTFKKIAELGYMGAICNYAQMCHSKKYGLQNLEDARIYYTKAIAKDYVNKSSDAFADAFYSLASMQFQGQGGPEDKVAAMHNFKKALDLGHPNALETIELIERGIDIFFKSFKND
ncbi:MAG: hypothetical protein Q8K37_05090, partial [Alphaproteobacteria bacterium]|nr:hypothetical protein [Alphaproteobacteria bacterium]